MRLDKLDKGERFDFAKKGGETEMLWKVAVEDELEADVVESHHLMEIPIVPECKEVRKPPLEATPIRTAMLVDAEAETCVLILEMKILDEVELLHALPASGKSEAGEHGA